MSLSGYLLGGLIRVGYERDGGRYERLGGVGGAGLLKRLLPEPTKVKQIIRSGVRGRYTYKGAINIKKRNTGVGADYIIRGSRLRLNKFEVRGGGSRNAPGKLYVRVLQGGGGIVDRAFRMKSKGKYRGTLWRRDTEARLPIHMLYGPSVAEMAGKEPEPADKVTEALREAFRASAELRGVSDAVGAAVIG